MKLIISITLIFIASTLVIAKKFDEIKIDSQTIKASTETKSGNTLYIFDLQADIVITTGEENKINVKATIETGDMGAENKERFFEKTSLSLKAYKNGYRVILKTPEQSWIAENTSLIKRLFSVINDNDVSAISRTLEIEVPENQLIVIDNKYGNVSVNDVNGDIEIENQSGDVYLNKTSGKAVINNEYSDIIVEKHSGDLNIEATSTKIRLETIEGNTNIINNYKSVDVFDIQGDFILSGTSIEVNAKNIAGKCRIENSYKSVNLENIKGSIELYGTSMDTRIVKADSNVFIEGSYKPIHIDNIAGNLNISATSATIDAKKIAGSVNIKNAYKDITLKGVEGTVDIDSESSSIYISNSKKDVNIEASYKSIDLKNVNGNLKINSNSCEIKMDTIDGNVDIVNFYKPINGMNLGGNVTIDGSSCSILLTDVKNDIDIKNEYKYVILKGTSGSIKIHGNSSPVEISDIKAISEIDNIEVFTTYKTVKVELPSDIEAQIAAYSEYGDVKSDFPVYFMDEGVPRFDNKKGGPKIQLETTSDILGIDIGGSGIKGALVNSETGQLLTERLRFPTPKPATPQAVANIVKQIVNEFKWNKSVGCGFPAVVRDGVVRTASNIDNKWIGTPVNKLFSDKTGLNFNVINDADAAGLAEIKFGAGQDRKGVVVLITVGTGLGSAIFVNGQLVPNTELGHVYLKDNIAEEYASDATRKKEDLSWPKWAKRFNKYLDHLEMLFWPDLIIIGGGASKKQEKFLGYIKLNCEVTEAKLLNHAGIIGAALAAK